jgi:hypothetical protein
MDFKTYWVQTSQRVVLHDGPSNKSADLCRVNALQNMLVISDEDSDVWLRLYDPVTKLQGYIDWPHLTVVPDPPGAQNDPDVARQSGWPPEWPTVIEANRLIRVVTWTLFIAFGLLAAWKTGDFDAFILWGTAFFLASDLLVFTKIWPWYGVWPLALGALKPRSPVTLLALLLSAGMSVLYPLLDYSSTQWYWVNDYRSIPTIVVPVVIFALARLLRFLASRESEPLPEPAMTPEAAPR